MTSSPPRDKENMKSKISQEAEAQAVLVELRGLSDPVKKAGMAGFGITGGQVLGIPMELLRKMARRLGCNHELGMELWASGCFEARLVAAWICDPARLTRGQARAWAGDFENWADCDGVCIHYFRKSPLAHSLAVEFAGERSEFVKRTGFTLFATLAVHDKGAEDSVFEGYLAIVERESDDARNGVKKGVNWALRQIGKRNATLRESAIRCAERIRDRGTPAARWIASDALREFKRIPVRKTPVKK